MGCGQEAQEGIERSEKRGYSYKKKKKEKKEEALRYQYHGVDSLL